MAAVSYIFTATRVAKMLGVEEDILHEIANTLDPEDGVISVYDRKRRFQATYAHGSRSSMRFAGQPATIFSRTSVM